MSGTRRTEGARSHRQLFVTVGAANLADGVYIAAGPLMAASLTSDPALVAGVAVAQRLAVVLALPASGVAVDRFDRRALVGWGNLARGGVLAALAVVLLAGADGALALVGLYAAAVVLGGAEAFVDTAALSLPPHIANPDQLDGVNGRIEAWTSAGQEFAGPPAGSLLFTVAAWAPFVGAATAFALASASVRRMRGSFRPHDGPPTGGTTAWRELREGWAWFWGHRLLRSAAMGSAAANVLAFGALSILVLLVTDELGFSPAVYGVLLVGLAVGGFAAGWTVTAISSRLGPGGTILAGNLGVAGGFLLLATTPSALVVFAALVAVSYAATTNRIIFFTLRQTIVPRELLGRVMASYRLFALAGMPVGAATGGLVARVDLTLPYWIASAGFVVLAAVLGVVLRNSRIDAARRGLGGDGAPAGGTAPVARSDGPRAEESARR